MTNLTCRAPGQRSPCKPRAAIREDVTFPILMPLLTLVCVDPISWQANSSSPTSPSTGPALPPPVALLSSSVAPLSLPAYVSAHRNHWPRSGSPLTIRHVGKLFQGERQPFKSSGQGVKADAPWESTERTLKFPDEGKMSSPLWLQEALEAPRVRFLNWRSGRERGNTRKNNQLEGCNFSLAHYHGDAGYC